MYIHKCLKYKETKAGPKLLAGFKLAPEIGAIIKTKKPKVAPMENDPTLAGTP